MIAFTSTKKEGVWGRWKLHLNLHGEQWSVIRHVGDKPFIPPYCEILTRDGWKPVINNTAPLRYVTEAEVEQVLA